MINIKIVKESDKNIEIEMENEKPTLFMLIKNELDKMDNVLFSAWKEDHPLTKNVRLKVVTNGKIKARDAIIKAIEKSLKLLNDIEKKIDNLE